jgi:hypothetical protein
MHLKIVEKVCGNIFIRDLPVVIRVWHESVSIKKSIVATN